MNKKTFKIFVKIFCVFAVIILISSNIQYVFGAVNNFKPSGFEGKTNAKMESGIVTGFGAALGIIRVVGTGIAMIGLLIIAIRYMAASPGQRADYKKNLIGFTIGAFILIAASQILGIISTLSSDVMK